MSRLEISTPLSKLEKNPYSEMTLEKAMIILNISRRDSYRSADPRKVKNCPDVLFSQNTACSSSLN